MLELKEKLTVFARQNGIQIELLDQIDSTNNRAAQKCYGAGDVIIAETQSAGRGQRGNSWSSLPGQNLTFSVVLQPDFLLASIPHLQNCSTGRGRYHRRYWPYSIDQVAK